MKRKLLTIAFCLILCLPVGVQAEETEADNTARIAEIKAQIAELEAELKELEGDTAVSEGSVLYQDDKVVITYDGITEGSLGGYEINYIIENLTAENTLTVQMRESSINGFMVDPSFSAEIAPGKKIKDGARIFGDDAESTPMDAVESIETKFIVYVDSFTESYETDNIVIM